MKSFEINLAVVRGAKDQTRKVFVSAETKEQVENCEGVKEIWERPDMQPDECPMQIKFDAITEKFTEK